jgi:hypothetical protein
MAYSDFNLSRVKGAFELTLVEDRDLFAATALVAPSEMLKTILADYIPLATAISTEKARSEFLIAPLLAEVRRQLRNQVSLFLGSEFLVDPAQGLNGFCDYIISASREQLLITAPVMMIVEAKREDIIGGLGQCIAAMVAAQLFNQREGNAIEQIYGVVTSGTNWKFLTLADKTVAVDRVEYYINQVDKILGILMEPFQPKLSAVWA